MNGGAERASEGGSTGRGRAHGRLVDAARLLPFFGAAMLLAPDLVLSGGPAAVGATGPWLNYLFAAWLGLIGLAAWLARGLGRDLGRARGPDGR